MYKAAIYIPYFPGFYDTILAPDDERIRDYLEDDIIDEVEYPIKNFEKFETAIEDTDYYNFFDNTVYEESVGEAFVKALNDYIRGKGERIIDHFVFEYESIHSPAQYNFGNDEINGYVSVEFKKLAEYMEANAEEFEKYLTEHYSSRDGFCSFVPTNLEDFRRELKEEDKRTVDRDIGILVEFAIEKELGMSAEEISEELCEEALENIYEVDYCDRYGFAHEIVRKYRKL